MPPATGDFGASVAIEVFNSAAAVKYLLSSIAANRSIRVGAEGNTIVTVRVAAIACTPMNVRQAQVIPTTNDLRYDAINLITSPLPFDLSISGTIGAEKRDANNRR
jgi:hypothetical protein